MAQGFDEYLKFIDDFEAIGGYHDCADFDGFHLVTGMLWRSPQMASRSTTNIYWY